MNVNYEPLQVEDLDCTHSWVFKQTHKYSLGGGWQTNVEEYYCSKCLWTTQRPTSEALYALEDKHRDARMTPMEKMVRGVQTYGR